LNIVAGLEGNIDSYQQGGSCFVLVIHIGKIWAKNFCEKNEDYDLGSVTIYP